MQQTTFPQQNFPQNQTEFAQGSTQTTPPTQQYYQPRPVNNSNLSYQNDPQYAGFLKRLVAHFIDSFIVRMISGIVAVPITVVFTAPSILENEKVSETASSLSFIIIYFTTTILSWLYYAIMESSGKQATLGKLALGLKVTDLNGNKISFARATGRYFAKIITGLTFYIGYLMVLFTEKKQTLHDMIAGCVIVKK